MPCSKQTRKEPAWDSPVQSQSITGLCSFGNKAGDKDQIHPSFPILIEIIVRPYVGLLFCYLQENISSFELFRDPNLLRGTQIAFFASGFVNPHAIHAG
jgi:hypothetical protein